MELLAELKELGIANKQLGAELQMFKDCDPAILEAKGSISFILKTLTIKEYSPKRVHHS